MSRNEAKTVFGETRVGGDGTAKLLCILHRRSQGAMASHIFSIYSHFVL